MITMRALLAALTNAVRGWRPIGSYRSGPARRVDVWLHIPAGQGGAHRADGFRVTGAWRGGDGGWRHIDGSPLRADCITHWRPPPPPPGGLT